MFICDHTLNVWCWISFTFYSLRTFQPEEVHFKGNISQRLTLTWHSGIVEFFGRSGGWPASQFAGHSSVFWNVETSWATAGRVLSKLGRFDHCTSNAWSWAGTLYPLPDNPGARWDLVNILLQLRMFVSQQLKNCPPTGSWCFGGRSILCLRQYKKFKRSKFSLKGRQVNYDDRTNWSCGMFKWQPIRRVTQDQANTRPWAVHLNCWMACLNLLVSFKLETWTWLCSQWSFWAFWTRVSASGISDSGRQSVYAFPRLRFRFWL